ncbi:MAG: SDR family oxidoreductase [Acidimicrobiia bacterium]
MRIAGRTVVVTGAGAGGGIGAALCRRFAAEGAAGIVVSDRVGQGAREIAAEVGGIAVEADLAVPADVDRLVTSAIEQLGHVDLFCSNAGVRFGVGIGAATETWERTWQVNTLAHVLAARAVLPSMLERGEGYLLQTVSAAGLLTDMGDVAYSVTKHAALGLAEWLAVTYGDRGIRVSCLCPQGVRTEMLAAAGDPMLADGAIEPGDVAEAVVAGLADERFLILPHPLVADYVRRRADDRDRWLGGMRRLRRSLPAAWLEPLG